MTNSCEIAVRSRVMNARESSNTNELRTKLVLNTVNKIRNYLNVVVLVAVRGESIEQDSVF